MKNYEVWVSPDGHSPFLDQLWFVVIQGPHSLVPRFPKGVPFLEILGRPGKGKETPLVAARHKHLKVQFSVHPEKKVSHKALVEDIPRAKV